ncbi:spore germination protein [Brevibacillus humidisoli]|uniref:spore germination protein n=1 Tax=Brevibacillus humidisoli TaxID=2895522 RepID=UPI001E305F05|nr:spore germination protein [Brevibacillus humidisoli]UFJ39191.1 spore germination protein [Brevibacillus humidisoli]
MSIREQWRQMKNKKRQKVHEDHFHQTMQSVPARPLTTDLKENIQMISQILGSTDDLAIRLIRLKESGKSAAVLHLSGMAKKEDISEFIVKYLTTSIHESEEPAIHEIERGADLRHVIRSILSGNAILLIEGKREAYIASTPGWDRRGVEEPRVEAVVRGPRDGFTETLTVNAALIRFRLRDPNLRLRRLVVGERTQTAVNVMYLDGLADPGIVDEVIQRIQKIRVDGVLESGYIEQFIEDRTWSPFPQIQNTERPDKVVANLLEGKVAILVEGTPFVLVAPAVFSQFYQSPEDYYERFYISIFIRVIRFTSMMIALFLPSLYIAFSSFHPEMIPSKLVIAMAAGRSTVPFPSIVEAFIMEITIEILREASVRLPGPIGPTIGIVGALVVGEAAVTAGLASPIMVIIVALTTIGSFATPSYSAAISIRMLRFPMMIMAGIFGLYGIMLFLILIVIHLSSIKSFGVPYMSPLSPIKIRDMRDLLVRLPLSRMRRRPSLFNPLDEVRMERREGP